MVRCADCCTTGFCNALGRTHSDDADDISHEDVDTTGSKDNRGHRCTHAHADLMAPQTPSSRSARESCARLCSLNAGVGGCAGTGIHKVSAHGMQGRAHEPQRAAVPPDAALVRTQTRTETEHSPWWMQHTKGRSAAHGVGHRLPSHLVCTSRPSAAGTEPHKVRTRTYERDEAHAEGKRG